MNFKSIMGSVGFFSTITKAMMNVTKIVRSAEYTLMLENVMPEPELSPVSKYDKASKRDVMPEAKRKAPFKSIFLHFDGEKGFVSCSMLYGYWGYYLIVMMKLKSDDLISIGLCLISLTFKNLIMTM